MGLTQTFSLMFLANGLALYFANFTFEGVSLPTDLEGFAAVAAALSLINLFIRPLVRLALGPILLITLGLGAVLVNAVTVYILDLLMPTATIEGLVNLLIVGVVVSISNIVISLIAKFI